MVFSLGSCYQCAHFTKKHHGKSSLSTQSVLFFNVLLMRTADVWNPKRLCNFFSVCHIFIGNAFPEKRSEWMCVCEWVSEQCAYTRHKKSAKVNLLNVHSDSFEWRDVEILSPSVRDRAPFFLPLYVCSFLAVCIGRDKGTISSPSIHRILFAFDAFVNNTITKQTLTLSLPFGFHVFF